MPDFEVTLPNGKPITIEAPEGTSDDKLMRFALKEYNEQKEGFLQFFGRGLVKSVKGSLAAGGAAEERGALEPEEAFRERQAGPAKVEAQYPAPKTLKGRIAQGVGEGLANPSNLLPGPGGFAGRMIAGAAAGAGSEIAGHLSKDNPLARILGGVAGGVAGGQIARPVQAGMQRAGAAARPSIPPTRLPAVQELQAQGIQPSAGDALGSRTVRELERLGDYWFGGQTYTRLKEETLGEFTNVAVQAMGERGNRLTPQMVRNVENRFEQTAQRVAKELNIKHDKTLENELVKIEQDMFKYGHSDEVVRRIHALIAHVNENFVTKIRKGEEIGEMGGRAYQALTVYGENMGQAMRDSNSNIANFAGRVRTALDDAMERTVESAVKRLSSTDPTTSFRRGQAGLPARARAIRLASALNDLRTARREWYNMIVLSKSVAGPGPSSAQGLVLPERLLQNLTNGQDNKLAYAARRTDLQRLANVGVQIIEPYSRPPSWRSGVAPLLAVGSLLTGHMGLGTAAATTVGPGVLGRAVNSPAVQGYLRNQRVGNLTSQLMSWREAAARGGLVGATSQPPGQGNQQMATPVSPMMLGRAKDMLGKTASADEAPPVKGARRAPDGHWYVKKPHAKGQYQRVVMNDAKSGSG